ncbi:SH3 domain-containing protein [Sulfurospirillum arcachonense]|uniref:bifunctional C40 family peptidase/M15 family metallopeptidase n=1 Tax=Sulfurospirillum arcachonense TaxID=57666 RepID=UPI00046895AF|nr:SH3 domain-containing protein [Sulfurospirillum arcachonense]
MKTLHIALSIFLLFLVVGCSSKHPKLLIYEQNASLYINKIEPLHVNEKNFKSRYFMPWSIEKIKIEKEKASWANFVFKKKDIYYAENKLPWNLEDIKKILKTTNFSKYNSKLLYAITVKNAQIRNLPTLKPFYKKTSIAGEGFPFDYLQNSRIHVNTPVLISHYTIDGSWAFVQTPFSSGWLPSHSFVLLDAKQRLEFKRSPKIVITTDNTALYTDKQQYLLHVKLGALFPIINEDENFYYSYIYKDMFNQTNKALHVTIPKAVAHTMPLVYNKENLLHVSNELLGEKYGWGGYLDNRDCSAFTKDFFTPFGLWLPRNSFGQKQSGEYISFEGLNNEEKEKMILSQGIAYLSLIYLQGHIMLYAGEFEGKAMVMHNTWGIKTYKDDVESRAIVGKTIFSDLHLGENQNNVPKEALLISKAKGIVIKPDMPSFVYHNLTKAYPSIEKVENNLLYFDDNTTLEYHDYVQKDFQTMIEHPSIKDTLRVRYPAFAEITAPQKNFDPGRFRNEALLKKLYGKNEQEIKQNLVPISWIDGSTLFFNKKQNASVQLEKVITELKKLPQEDKKYLENISGTFTYRNIAGTKRLSPHSFGISIDINVKNSAYWRWDKNLVYKNKIPKEIVEIFEKYGFIWGGRWYHYDTMHFEYRPELFDTID